jgi:glycosyltransferase involved in cell wall biosynthesis
MEVAAQAPLVQVIVPARNEEDCIAACLKSLTQQQGIAFHVTVVDDGSTDQTRAIAESFPGVCVISAAEATSGVTGKCNALICGAKDARAEWLLFTDADTIHLPGSLAAAVENAQDHHLDLLSYSPEQQMVTWGERALMPVVFAELAREFPPERVNDPGDPTAAANGQYILVRRHVYERLGGHRVVAKQILEDVELARLFKRSGCKIGFHHGAGLVQARMYRSFSAMAEGWTKNLALLFSHPIGLAIVRAIEFAIITGCLIATAFFAANDRSAAILCGLAAIVMCGNFVWRICKAGFSLKSGPLAFFGLPLFSFLLLRSYWHWHVRKTVAWKGRTYTHSAPRTHISSSIQKEGSQRLT